MSRGFLLLDADIREAVRFSVEHILQPVDGLDVVAVHLTPARVFDFLDLEAFHLGEQGQHFADTGAGGRLRVTEVFLQPRDSGYGFPVSVVTEMPLLHRILI